MIFHSFFLFFLKKIFSTFSVLFSVHTLSLFFYFIFFFLRKRKSQKIYCRTLWSLCVHFHFFFWCIHSFFFNSFILNTGLEPLTFQLQYQHFTRLTTCPFMSKGCVPKFEPAIADLAIADVHCTHLPVTSFLSFSSLIFTKH